MGRLLSCVDTAALVCSMHILQRNLYVYALSHRLLNGFAHYDRPENVTTRACENLLTFNDLYKNCNLQLKWYFRV